MNITLTDNREKEVNLCLRGEVIALADDATDGENKAIWIQVAKQGKFRGHAAGAFEMTAETFAQIIANFKATKNQRIPVDFEHASEQPAAQGNIPFMGAPAQGWILDLAIRPDGNLWALVEWLPLAKQYIKAKQYLYISPAIVFGGKDRVTGKPCGARLSSIALTNNPFLDGMTPVAAKHKESSAEAPNGDIVDAMRTVLSLPEYVETSVLVAMLKAAEGIGLVATAKLLREGLRLPLTMTAEDVIATALKACGVPQVIEPIVDSQPTAPAVTHENPPVTARNEGEPIMGDATKEKDLETQVSQLTLKLSAAESETAQVKREVEAEVKRLTDENVALTAKLTEFQDKELNATVATAIATYGEKMGLTDQSRPHLMRIAKNDPEGFAALYPAVPAAQQHLGRTLAAGPHAVPPTNVNMNAHGTGRVVDMAEASKDVPEVSEIAEELIATAKSRGINMSREEAFTKAHTKRLSMIKANVTKLAAGGI